MTFSTTTGTGATETTCLNHANGRNTREALREECEQARARLREERENPKLARMRRMVEQWEKEF